MVSAFRNEEITADIDSTDRRSKCSYCDCRKAAAVVCGWNPTDFGKFGIERGQEQCQAMSGKWEGVRGGLSPGPQHRSKCPDRYYGVTALLSAFC